MSTTTEESEWLAIVSTPEFTDKCESCERSEPEVTLGTVPIYSGIYVDTTSYVIGATRYASHKYRGIQKHNFLVCTECKNRAVQAGILSFVVPFVIWVVIVFYGEMHWFLGIVIGIFVVIPLATLLYRVAFAPLLIPCEQRIEDDWLKFRALYIRHSRSGVPLGKIQVFTSLEYDKLEKSAK